MSEKQSTRRKFLQLFGLTAGAAIVSGNVMAAGFDKEEIKKLTPPQQEFMLHYEEWMTEYIGVIRIQKTDPDNMAEAFQPALAVFMQDPTFALIFKVSIERMVKEI
jgi:hypothetical protein